VPTAYVLINSDLGTDESIISKIKEVLKDEKDVEFTTQGVYGIYDIVLKISSDNTDILRNIITYKIRKINKVQSTLTMMVVEELEKSD
jgi:DNA-binding Lrp family transcriptional regulator